MNTEINLFNKVTMTPACVNNPDKVIEDNPGVFIKNPPLDIIYGVPKKYWKVVNDQLVEMTQAEKDVIDSSELPSLKKKKKDEVDRKTSELLLEGFIYDGQLFSMSKNAQGNWNGIGTALALEMTMNYPYPISTKDGQEYTLADSIEVKAFLDAFKLFKETTMASGRTLWAQIDGTTTKAELDGIVDNR